MRNNRHSLATTAIGCFIALGAAAALAQSRAVTDTARNKMVDEEIVAAGVKDPRVIEAMRKTPRHEFVPLNQRKNAYFDMALPIGEGQTISPPFVVAYMTEAIDPQPTDKVLEIGTGSGGSPATLSKPPFSMVGRAGSGKTSRPASARPVMGTNSVGCNASDTMRPSRFCSR